MSKTDCLVRLQGVTKDFPKVTTGGDRLRALASLFLSRRDAPRFRALDAIDLDVRRGESVGLIGENGAGKSTLLKIIARVTRPTAGTVAIDGRVGALLELGSGFHQDYTGRENIGLSGALIGLSPREIARKTDAIIDFADIGEHIDDPIKHYSSGMVVRLGFAVATALDPDLLITDEVLAVGDESFQKKCIQWLENYREGGGTLLLVSHSMYHIQTLCSRALWLHHGSPRLLGTAFDVTREYLAYHEAKTAAKADAPPPPLGSTPRIVSLWSEDAEGRPQDTFPMGGTAVAQIVAYDPDDRPPVVLAGIARVNGVGISGAHSNDFDFVPARLAPNHFGYAIRYGPLDLLPGKYIFRVHALDGTGLRLFDTVTCEITVTGEVRDYGFIRPRQAWLPGRGAPLK